MQVGGREQRDAVSEGWSLLIASCRECRRLQHLVADRFEITPDGAHHRCPFCDVLFPIRWEDAVALGVVDTRGFSMQPNENSSAQLPHCA
jgi:hypothetical protein